MTTGRNDPCPCGSGLKYKRCCLDKDAGWIPPEVRESIARQQAEERARNRRRGVSPVAIAVALGAMAGGCR